VNVSFVHLFKELVIVPVINVNSNENRTGSVERLLEYRADRLTTSSAYDLLLSFVSRGEQGRRICCHRRDDPIVRAVDQIV
jgi:hypothetical protein